MTDPAGIRCALLAAGFLPLPLHGKAPAPSEWQKKLQTKIGRPFVSYLCPYCLQEQTARKFMRHVRQCALDERSRQGNGDI